MYFSETSHVSVISLDVLYRAHSGLYRDTKSFFKPSHTVLKMAIFIFIFYIFIIIIYFIFI